MLLNSINYHFKEKAVCDQKKKYFYKMYNPQ